MSRSHERRPARAVLWASRLLVFFGVIVAVNGAVALVRGVTVGIADTAFAVVMLIVTVVGAQGLRRGARWAWFGTILLALGGLFFIAPVVGTIALGGGLDPVGTGWDFVYFPLMTVTLLSILLLLRAAGSPAGPISR